MMSKKTTYREVQYVVGYSNGRSGRVVEFFPIIVIDGQEATARAGADDEQYLWAARSDNYREMSMAYGSALAACDQANASLQERGLNRLREVS